MEAGGGATYCSAAELLSATYLICCSGTEAGIVGFPLLPFSQPAHLRSFDHSVSTVPDGPPTSEVNGLSAVGTDMV